MGKLIRGWGSGGGYRKYLLGLLFRNSYGKIRSDASLNIVNWAHAFITTPSWNPSKWLKKRGKKSSFIKPRRMKRAEAARDEQELITNIGRQTGRWMVRLTEQQESLLCQGNYKNRDNLLLETSVKAQKVGPPVSPLVQGMTEQGDHRWSFSSSVSQPTQQ